MALMTCPDCAGPLSTSAGTCPRCGWVRPRAARKPITGAAALLIAIGYPVAAVLVMYAFPSYAVIVFLLAWAGAIWLWRSRRIRFRSAAPAAEGNGEA